MKMLHISDLHLGKRLNEFSLLEDQKYILSQILRIAEQEKPDCLLIAGDVYDKSVPPADAVALFDAFLSSLAEKALPVFIISGNHDSPERIAFGAKIMENSRIYVSPVYNGSVSPITLSDSYGEVRFYLLPFLRPAAVRSFFPDVKIDSETAAVKAAVDAMQLDTSVRNVLVCHQFVTGGEKSGSEEIYVGGIENVDASVFDGFAYTALGHIHKCQKVTDTVCYCGTPMKYSFSEWKHEKSVTIAELGEAGKPVSVRQIPLVPFRDMEELRGQFDAFMSGSGSDLYVRVILEDEDIIPDAIGRLRMKYPNIMALEYDNRRTRSDTNLEIPDTMNEKTPMKLFSEFYERLNGSTLTEEQSRILEETISEIWEDALCDH